MTGFPDQFYSLHWPGNGSVPFFAFPWWSRKRQMTATENRKLSARCRSFSLLFVPGTRIVRTKGNDRVECSAPGADGDSWKLFTIHPIDSEGSAVSFVFVVWNQVQRRVPQGNHECELHHHSVSLTSLCQPWKNSPDKSEGIKQGSSVNLVSQISHLRRCVWNALSYLTHLHSFP